MQEIVIKGQEANQRVDKYVRKYLNNAPLNFIYRLFRKKDVKINGHWVDINYVLKENDTLRLYVTDQQIAELSKPKEMPNTKVVESVVFEDDNILIVNKSKGILVHGDENEKVHTLSNQVLNYLMQKEEYNPREIKGFVPAPAHRLDRNTSGLVIFAKNLIALQELESMFKTRKGIEKHYMALVVGTVNKGRTIDFPLKKDAKAKLVKVDKVANGALEAKTEISVIRHYGDYTLLDVRLLTGRTHQIRVHLKAIGHPIIGDGKYGDFKQNRLFKEQFNYDTQFLHAYRLKFVDNGGLLQYLNNHEVISTMSKTETDILDALDTKEKKKW
ncbi:MAG: RluA family pseudouridine synthase [Bacilli bacterium]|jgi:23S rRNA pseudouridine955/2504/2580 synthase|nr:RluA family pseudouridine synthase [Bacilli bacterium]MDD4005575.1 RluA family pseudouridine synthase [Bacilli bacterium]